MRYDIYIYIYIYIWTAKVSNIQWQETFAPHQILQYQNFIGTDIAFHIFNRFVGPPLFCSVFNIFFLLRVLHLTNTDSCDNEVMAPLT